MCNFRLEDALQKVNGLKYRRTFLKKLGIQKKLLNRLETFSFCELEIFLKR